MIALVWSMLRARRGQAIILTLLSVFATAAAVAGPAYLRAVDHAAVATEVAEADREELTVTVSGAVGGSGGRADSFDNLATSMLRLPGFTTVYSGEFPVLGVEEGDQIVSALTLREDVCPRLKLVAGRCLMTTGETVIGESTAARRGITPGDTVTVTAAQYSELLRRFVPAGIPATLTVVGVYRPADPADRYWGRTTYFLPGIPDHYREPVFVTRPSFDTIDHPDDTRAVSAVPGPDAFALDGLPALRAELAEITEDLNAADVPPTGQYATVQLDLPAVLDRVDRARELARQVVPVAAVPLVALCWFVIFLAVGAGTSARRHELGLVSLRGARWPVRWWLTGGESVLAILAGAPVGLLLGLVGVDLLTRARFDAGIAGVSVAAVAVAASLAVGGALAAGLFAQRRELGGPVVDLLRRVPARSTHWRSLAAEATVAALAVVAAFQLRGFDGELVGLSLLVPGLVGLAVAMLAARLLLPIAVRSGARALRRGRVAPALGAFQLARRPGGSRLFLLLAVASALFGFAVVAVDVAGQARADRAELATGADRRLTLLPVEAGALLAAVRGVDPEGRYAMAAGLVEGDGERQPPVLLVDSPALHQVAHWRNADVAPAVDSLRPPTGDPFVLRDTRATLSVVGPERPAGAELTVTVVLRAVSGGPPIRIPFGPIVTGARDYPADVASCATGCRVVAVEASSRQISGQWTELLVTGLRGGDPDSPVIDAAAFARRWRPPVGEPVDGGLRIEVSVPAPAGGIVARPDDVPERLPAVVAGQLPPNQAMPGVDSVRRPVEPVGSATVLPRVGAAGALVDLEYATRQAAGSSLLPVAEVWLAPDAPPDLPDRLRAAGLSIVAEQSAAAEQVRLDGQAPALAIWFHLLAGGLALVLALCGLVLAGAADRRRRRDDTRALRLQGLPARLTARAELWSLLPLVAAALLTGLAAAVGAWWLAGEYLPLFTDRDFPMAGVAWPDLVAVGSRWAVVAVLIAGVAVGLARAARVRD
nr:ABC transporter permease [Micromonospora sp. DSM 115978]